MKTIKYFFNGFIFVLAVITFSPNICGAINYVCIDPGHGGTASGSVGGAFGTLEKNANLKVALALKDTLEISGYPDTVIKVIMTRQIDTTLSFQRRAEIAMGDNRDSARANQFIVIHHNGSDNDTINYTMTIWCPYVYEIPGDTTDRDTSVALAERVQAKMVEVLGYREASERLKDSCLYVLEHTSMISAYPEVSFITCRKIDSLFYYDSLSYPKKEASGIYRGWYQYIEDDPIVVIRNHFGGGWVWVDGIYRESPFHGCWRHDEYHTIGAFDQWWGDNYYYCKWSDWGAQYHGFWVGFVDEVRSAYFSYDGYYVHVDYPNGGQSYEVGKNMQIRWSADPGVYDPPYCWWTYVDIYLSRNGGSSFHDTIVTNYPMMGFSSDDYDWTVNGTASSQCRIKIVAHDDACNQDDDVSDYNFAISYRATVESPHAGDEWDIGRQHPIKWTASPGHNSTSLVDIYLSRNGGSTWETLLTDVPFDTIAYPWDPEGKIYWLVSGNTSNNCRIKIRVHDSVGNNVEAVSGTFSVTYKVTLILPEHFMCVGWRWIIRCEVSPGQGTTTVVDFYLSRDGGATWPEYLGSRPYNRTPWGDDTLSWPVVPPPTNQAQIKLYAHDNFGHTAEYITPYEFTICGGCVRGDIRKDGVFYNISDAVTFARWWVDSSSACDPDPVYGISPCDVNCDGKVSLSDLIILVRIMLGDISPCDTGPPYGPGSPPYAGEIEVQANENIISVSSDYPLGAMAFDFTTDGTAANPVLIVPNMQLKTSVQNGKLRVLVWNENGESIPSGTQDLFNISGSVELVSVRAAGDDGKEFKANIMSDMTPSTYALSQNHPNPFNPQTQIEFSLAEVSRVSLVIYNLLGQKVITLLDKTLPPGKYVINWNGEDESRQKVASGIYFYRLQAGKYNEARRMTLLK